MEVDHVLGTGSLVQGIDVLGNHAVDLAQTLGRGEREVPTVRLSLGDSTPADIAASPVPNLRGLRTHKGVEGHWVTCNATLATIVGDSRISGNSGTGKRDYRLAGEFFAGIIDAVKHCSAKRFEVFHYLKSNFHLADQLLRGKIRA